MAESTEPPNKKTKMEGIDEFIQNIVDSKTNLLAVMDDAFINPIPFIKCYTGQVKDIKQLSGIIQILNEKLPLEDLSHLKRVTKRSVLICPVSYFNKFNYDCIGDFIQGHVPELKDTFEYIRDVEMPAIAPLTKKQNIQCSKNWNCNFHPNKHVEKMMSDSCFIQRELRLHRKYMGMALEVAKIHLIRNSTTPTLQDLCSINAAIVVDPTIDHIVAIATDNRQDHPTQHPAMVAIDNVAKTQNGGVWEQDEELTKEIIVKLRNRFIDVAFGARKFCSKKDSTAEDDIDNSPYLCTGYDIYLVREPCVMCTMGLVHARIKRVFYMCQNSEFGALGSKTKLHCIPSLNHRFEVFTGFEK